jgi:serine/threonine protein kinase
MILSPGDSLQNGKYIIEKSLGKGGFGITYKAENRGLERTVVIKTINEEKIQDTNNQKYLTRFKREARVLANLIRHPHIVQVYDLFEENGIPYLVMEFLSGESLGSLVKKQGKLSESLALQYISQIGSALEFVHKGNLVHRDAHPDNIMIVQNKAILIDFGIVGRIDASYITNEHPTHYYFAPYEQRDGSIDPKVDIYAIAASLYYALTAQHPTPSLNRKYKNESLIPPKQLNSSISLKVEAAILKGMELEAKNRPQSMQDWLKLLTRTSSENDESQQNAQVSWFQDLITNLRQVLFTASPPTLPRNEAPSDELSSEKGVDYTRLRDLLKAGRWKEADEETSAVMLKAAGRGGKGWLDYDDVENFPCADLRTIDQLWVKYSNGRFGFSVQKQIYLKVGGIPDGKYNQEAWDKLGERLGWRVKRRWIFYDDVTFNTTAPRGHLPFVTSRVGAFSGLCYSSLAWRLMNCNL